MGLNLKDLTPVHDTFHEVIPGKLSTSIGHINLEVSYGTGDNNHKEMLTTTLGTTASSGGLSS
jgi:hypothetical protein